MTTLSSLGVNAKGISCNICYNSDYNVVEVKRTTLYSEPNKDKAKRE